MRRLRNGLPGLACLSAACLFVSIPPARANTIHVPADKPTIQAGIDAAKKGDTVLVADGTYTGAGNIDLDFGGKAITLKSAHGAATCFIDCQQQGRAIIFQSGETAAATVDGFTIQNGAIGSPGGGGILIASGSPTVTHCLFNGNITVQSAGAGMVIEDGSPTVTDCAFNGNSANGDAGGMAVLGGSPTVTNCTFSNNVADAGAGMRVDNSSATVTDCTFSGNNATLGDGAGMMITHGGKVIVTNCIFWGDLGSEISAGSDDSNPTVTYSDVHGSYAGAGNINVDPLFVRNPAPGNNDSGDLHLQAGSPCAHAGSHTAPALPATDKDGVRRGTSPDMGAYEQEGKSDRSPPITTASFSGLAGSNGWFRGPITVTLNATDPDDVPADSGSDVARTYYRTDEIGAFQIYTSPFVVSTEGSATLQFYSIDKTGNVEATQEQPIKIDSAKPIVNCPVTQVEYQTNAFGAVVYYPAPWATDPTPGSGVASIICTPISGSRFVPGTTVVTCKATDRAGNPSVPRSFAVVVAPPPSTPNIHIAGNRKLRLTDGRPGYFDLAARFHANKNRSGKLEGHFRCTVDDNGQNRDRRLEVESTELTSVVVRGAQTRVFGKVRINHQGAFDFSVDVDTLGSNRPDLFALQINDGSRTGYSIGGVLTDGHLEIHTQQ